VNWTLEEPIALYLDASEEIERITA
jgi:hypothetical protein